MDTAPCESRMMEACIAYLRIFDCHGDKTCCPNSCMTHSQSFEITMFGCLLIIIHLYKWNMIRNSSGADPGFAKQGAQFEVVVAGGLPHSYSVAIFSK